ncbi:MAG: VWA domain-containing protein, partial [Micrococcales bacterium]|nr:VWA domain-containing protein [Micrococcales bacterium]
MILLLVVTALWFVLGPMRHAREESAPPKASTAWGSAAPNAAKSPDGTLGSPGTSGPSKDAPSSRSTGGIFDAIDEAMRRRAQERATSEPSRSTPGPARRSTDSGSSSGPESPRVTTRGSIPADADKIMLILDASGSMARRTSDGSTSMEAAQDALANALETIPEGTPVGLRVFGSRVDGLGRPTPQACRDTRVVQPIAPLDRRQMTTAIFSFDPLGESPIARSIAAAVDDLGTAGRRSILLVSDGAESCAPDPCRAVADARAAGVDVRIDAVGLRVQDRARDQLRCIAAATNGSYSEARTDSEVGTTLRAALQRLGAERTSGAAGTAAASKARAATTRGAPAADDAGGAATPASPASAASTSRTVSAASSSSSG